MDIAALKRETDFTWRIDPTGNMRVPGIIYASRKLVEVAEKIEQKAQALKEK